MATMKEMRRSVKSKDCEKKKKLLEAYTLEEQQATKEDDLPLWLREKLEEGKAAQPLKDNDDPSVELENGTVPPLEPETLATKDGKKVISAADREKCNKMDRKKKAAAAQR